MLEIKNISKKFRIRHEQQPYLSLRDSITSFFKNPVSNIQYPASEEFWALKDISFDVVPGESIGIIGKNGAGKSTLLKILSKITPPTEGKIISRGRIASLLEVGTGFHPELTGRENVFLNGSILGMKRKEIQNKFDEIVDFSGVEKFLDTPLKHYSSGMQLRLAFAVAAFLEPEILMIDEVLAVGDVDFQKKCIKKMDDVSKKDGRTILFVSHDLGLILSICNNCILIDNGKIIMNANTQSVIEKYKMSIITQSNNPNLPIKVKGYFQNDKSWNDESNLIIEIVWPKYFLKPGWECDITCYTTNRVKIFSIASHLFDNFKSSNPEINTILFDIKSCNFAERNYLIDVGIREGRNVPYSYVIENSITINPSNPELPKYKRQDVICVPQARIELSTK
ncbi:MAG: ABC transporter ATP-binding protein [Bacteroidetes bacterium]|nr:ABC transporter ATP-binding protein [Bacteroidota bacterium]